MSRDWTELLELVIDVTDACVLRAGRDDDPRGGMLGFVVRGGDERIGATMGAHSGTNGFSSTRRVSSWFNRQSHGARHTRRFRRATLVRFEA